MKLPSYYLKSAGNYQIMSAISAVIGVGTTLVKNEVGANVVDSKISAGFGVLSLIFYIGSTIQLQNAGESLSRIKIENNGVVIKL